MQTQPAPAREIYVRFKTPDGQTGVFETPFETPGEALDVFLRDADADRAFELSFNGKGEIQAARDLTGTIRDLLIAEVEKGDVDICPHPMISDVFDKLKAGIDGQAEADAADIRAESAALRP